MEKRIHKLRLLFSVFYLFLPISFTLAAQNDIKFDHLSIEQGLSQNTIYSIIQDRKGFIWFGTQDGLNRYDGYNFTVYKHDPEVPTSLSYNHVSSLYEDQFGLLWVGTDGGGLDKFNPVTEKFIHYKHDPSSIGSLSSNVVFTITEDKFGNLWIGTLSGLNKFDRDTELFVRYKHNPDDLNSLSNNVVLTISEDRAGDLWVGTLSGLNKFNRDTEQFIHYKYDPSDSNSLSNDFIRRVYHNSSGDLWIGTGDGLNRFNPDTEHFIRYRSDPDNLDNLVNSLSNNVIGTIYEDRKGNLWVGTLNGLNKFNQKTEQFTQYKYDPDNPYSLSENVIRGIYQSRSGVLWVGTDAAGINFIHHQTERFKYYQHNPNDPSSLSFKRVTSFSEDPSGILWIGTYGKGLNMFDRKTGRFVHYQHNPDDPFSLSLDLVLSSFVDKSGVLWVGTDGGGLNKFDREKERFIHYKTDPQDSNSINNNLVLSIFEDKSNILLIGTDGGGLNKFDRKTERFMHYMADSKDPYSLSSNRVLSIYEDKAGILWIGTFGGGLNKFDQEAEQFVNYQADSNNPYSISHDVVLSIHEDKSGILWIGTYGGGLNKFDRETERFIHYREKHGLPNDVVYGILEDDHGNLWLSTNKGITKFNPVEETFKNFTVEDGLQSNEFNSNAYYKSNNGEMFFGGVNGFNSFFPDSIKDNPFIPPVILTDFQVFNKSVGVGDNSILQKHISESEIINLNYKQNVFSFEFTALNFINSEKNQYKYMMEGFDKDWIDSGTKRFATYTNLNPGEYVFKVIGSNNDGVWNTKGTSIKIVITPPFWKTWWFRIGILLSILFSAFSIHQRRIISLEEKKKELEERVEERTRAAEELQVALDEVEHLKNRLQAENIYLQDEIKLDHNFANIITRAKSLKAVLHKLEQVAATDTTVLILGESGTGKELLVRAVHNISNRSDRPLVKVDCAALPPNLIESELFGHEKGAFTGAINRKIGRFELADGGTIFLDEIGELPLELQVKLLRVIQDEEFERLGNSNTIKVDVRIIAATNRNLEKEIKNGSFREDLYYRLNVFPIVSPPLREHKEDIPILVNHLVKKYGSKTGKKIKSIPQNVLDIFESYNWPGNVRELENIVERAVIVTQGGQLRLGDWLPDLDVQTEISDFPSLIQNEKQHIIAALEKTNWRVSGEKGAGKLLGINPNTLDSRMRKLGISRKK